MTFSDTGSWEVLVPSELQHKIRTIVFCNKLSWGNSSVNEILHLNMNFYQSSQFVALSLQSE